jgi:MFS family permease
MRWIVRGAFVGHVAGALLIMVATGYVMAVAGSLLCGMGAGLVEAGCNPLVAALYPNDKTPKLNRFHMWFPYGNLIAAVILTLIFQTIGIGWRGQLTLILVPAVVYGVMMLMETYPPTEGVSAGVTVGESFKALFAPIMLVMMPMMLLTASMELPPSTWVPPVLQSGGVNGLLVFGFVFGIMGTLRLVAAPVVRVLTPTGILLAGAILATIGLYLFSNAESTFMAFATAAIWAVGIAYFWPTMLGFVSERNPKSGALGLGVMGAIGMLASFFVTPWLGQIADVEGHTRLPEAQTVAIFEQVTTDFPRLVAEAGPQAADIQGAIGAANNILSEYRSSGSLPAGETAQALRAVIGTGADSPVIAEAQSILNPADNYGGRSSFRKLAPIGIILIIVFGILFVRDRMTGGYKAEKLGGDGGH